MIVKNSKVPKYMSIFINVYSITLYPYVFIRDEGNEKTINHERIHLKQQRELWIVGFCMLYVAFWLFGLILKRSFHKAYMWIPFEKEAYANDHDFVYTLNRKRNAWKKYINLS